MGDKRLPGDDFLKAVKIGDPVKYYTDGTVEGDCRRSLALEANHEEFSGLLGHTGLVELFDVGIDKGPRCSGKFEQRPRSRIDLGCPRSRG